MESTVKNKLKPNLLTPKQYTALISVHIPFSSLEDNRMDYKSVAKSIAIKTKTHIECYELSHLSKIRFCIFGKWRDCLQSGRLLWYQLIRETTIYAHFDWSEELKKPLDDQRGKKFMHLYRSVKYKPLKDYNLLSISGPCWDVLKVRKELIRRKSTQDNDQQSVNTKREITALQILKCIRADIHDDIHTPDSIYSIRNSQLVQLFTGSKTTIDQIEDITCSKDKQRYQVLIKPLKTENQTDHKYLEEFNLLVNCSEHSKQDSIESLASILRQLSLKLTDTQILTQVQQLLRSNSCKVQEKVDAVEEVMIKFKPKRYSLLRSNLELNSNQLKTDRNAAEVINDSINSIETISLENEPQVNSKSHKMGKKADLMRKKDLFVISSSDSVMYKKEEQKAQNEIPFSIGLSEQQIKEKREHYLIAERIRELIANQKHSLCDEIQNESNETHYNNDCDQKFVNDLNNKKSKNRVSFTNDINNKKMFGFNFNKNSNIYKTEGSQLSHIDKNEIQKSDNKNMSNNNSISEQSLPSVQTRLPFMSLRKPFKNL